MKTAKTTKAETKDMFSQEREIECNVCCKIDGTEPMFFVPKARWKLFPDIAKPPEYAPDYVK